MGLGRHGGGVAAARYLAEHGATVTVTDLADAAMLADSLAALAGSPIERFHLGGHCEDDFTQTDLIVVNPAVRPDDRLVKRARESGARISSEIELFLDACPAPVIGVTGTNGKSTTAAMTAAAIAGGHGGRRCEAAGRRVWLGGNIGRSLLPELSRIRPDDWVVLELSSFQLHWLSDDARWPQFAMLTNFAPNHLDWHPSVEHYRRAKQRLLERAETVISPCSDAVVPPLRVPGRHNRANAALASAAAIAAGADRESIQLALSEFKGLPHRLAFVSEIAGRRFYNDSKATTPEAVVAALEAMERPTLILLGGSDKNVDLTPLARAVGARACGAGLFGATAAKLDAILAAHAPQLPRSRAETLDEAIVWCWAQSRPGDAILLSPACASLDQFRDYADRGDRFMQLGGQLSK